MGFKDRAKNGPAGREWRRCHTGLLLEDLPADEAKALRSMLALDSGWQTSEISHAIEAETGVKLTQSTLGRHRRGDCTCEPR